MTIVEKFNFLIRTLSYLPLRHQPQCNREVMRHADDSAKYLSEPCSCGLDKLLAELREAEERL